MFVNNNYEREIAHNLTEVYQNWISSGGFEEKRRMRAPSHSNIFFRFHAVFGK